MPVDPDRSWLAHCTRRPWHDGNIRGVARSTGRTAAVEGVISHSDYITFPAARGPGSTLTHFSTGKTGAGAQPALMVGHDYAQHFHDRGGQNGEVDARNQRS